MAEIISLGEAIQRFVNDGDTVALEGFTHLIPTAASHEIIRQNKRELTLVRMTPDLVYDLLIGAGCAKKLVFSWGGNPGVGSLHRLRDAVEKGWPKPLEIEEHSHASLCKFIPIRFPRFLSSICPWKPPVTHGLHFPISSVVKS
jgi:glutaconate CoA-transferase subunit A